MLHVNQVTVQYLSVGSYIITQFYIFISEIIDVAVEQTEIIISCPSYHHSHYHPHLLPHSVHPYNYISFVAPLIAATGANDNDDALMRG